MIFEISPAYSLLTLFWQSSLFLTAGLIVSFLLSRHSARAHHVLLLSIAAAIIVPALSIIVKHYELGFFTAKPDTQISSASDADLFDNSPSSELEFSDMEELQSMPMKKTEKLSLVAATFPWMITFLYVWAAASVVLLIRLLITFLESIRLIRKAQPLENQQINQSISTIAAKLQNKKVLSIFSSDRIISPVIWCWRHKSVLLIPSNLSLSNDKIDWEGIFCHEMAHLKRRDHIWGLLSELAVAIFPWHPLMWAARSRLINLSEMACDDWVVAGGGSGADYAETLLDLIPFRQAAFVPAIVRDKNALAERIRRILEDSCKNPYIGKNWIRSAIIITACIALIVAFAQCRSADLKQTDATMTSDNYEIIILKATGSTIRVNPNELSDDDLRKIDEFFIPHVIRDKITEISFLKKMINLIMLNLSRTKINNIEPLANLISLRSLDLSYSQVNDISALAKLRNLRKLDIRGTNVSDISVLVNLKKLTELRVDPPQFNDEQIIKLKIALPNLNICS
jgi:beta-lactamase regulating signal transducer with metallopeptidase domain